MKVAVIGHWSISRSDVDVIALEVLRCMQDPEVEELLFPGIDGAAATALCVALHARAQGARTKLTVVFPGKYGESPPWEDCDPSPEECAQQVDQVIEMGQPMGPYQNWPASLRLCGEYVIEQVAECGQVLVFWSGELIATDVSLLVKYIKARVIPWQHITIAGEETP